MSPMVSATPRRLRPTRRQVIGAAPILCGAALGLGGCRPGDSVSVDTPFAAELDPPTLAERYVRLALAIAKHQPSLVDAWLGPEDARAGARAPVPALRAETAMLRRDVERVLTSTGWSATRAAGLAGGGEGRLAVARVNYLAGQIRALDVAAGRLLGESLPFAEEVTGGLGHAPPARDAAALDVVRRDLDLLLPGAGALPERYATFRRRHAVPAARVESVFSEAVTWCDRQSRTVVTLPPKASMAVGTTDEGGWAGYSRPRDGWTSEVWASRTGGADVAHLLQLAAHEGVPGHHAQHVWATETLVEAHGWTERLLHPSFGPHRLMSEGTAEIGAERILPLDTRVDLCRTALLPVAGQPVEHAEAIVRVERLVARLDEEVAHIGAEYLSTSMTMETARQRLRHDALALDPDALLAFIERQRARLFAYPLGRTVVRQALGAGALSVQWRRLMAMATTLSIEGLPEE